MVLRMIYLPIIDYGRRSEACGLISPPTLHIQIET